MSTAQAQADCLGGIMESYVALVLLIMYYFYERMKKSDI
jgi:hypothetical protein